MDSSRDILLVPIRHGTTSATGYGLSGPAVQLAADSRVILSSVLVICRRVLDVVRLDQSKGLLTAKLKRSGWNDEFMLKLLSQMR